MAFSVQGDYLPTHGPVPIQFQGPPKARVLTALPFTKLPPPISTTQGEHPPQAPAETMEHPATIAAEHPAPEPESVIAKSPEPYISTAGLLFPLPPQEGTNETLTPQMLLQFFQSTGPGSKKSETTVAGNITFAPPRPDAKPPSKATVATP